MEEEFMWDLLSKDHGNGGHSRFSQHYAGLAFDVGQNLSAARKNRNAKPCNKLWNMELCGTCKPYTALGSF